MNFSIFRTGLILLFLPLMQQLQAQCNPDLDPPILACKTAYTVQLPIFGDTIQVPASALDNGSADACCAVNFEAVRAVDGPCDSDNLPDGLAQKLVFCCADKSTTFDVILQVADCNGNSATCTVPVTVKDYASPTAICDEFTVVAIGTDNPNDCYVPNGNNFAGISWVKAATFDDGSYDNCSNIKLTVRRVAPYSDCINTLNPVNGQPDCNDVFPDFPSEFERAISEGDSIKFYACEAGTQQTVALRVYQMNDNGTFSINQSGQPIYNDCLISVEVQDKIKPVVTCPANVTVSCENFDPSLWAYNLATATDNACLDTLLKSVNYTLFDTLCLKGTIYRTFTAKDCSANSAQCSQTIVVDYDQNYFVKFPNDLILTDCDNPATYGEPTFFGEDCELIGVSYQDEIFTGLPGLIYKIQRTWTIINWCTYNPNLPVVDIPNPNPNVIPDHPANLPGPIVSAPGTQAPWSSTIVKLTPDDPAPTDFSTFFNTDVNAYRYTQVIKVVAPVGTAVAGHVFSDTLQNCSYDAGESPLVDWQVQMVGTITGKVYLVTPESDGTFSQNICPGDTAVTLTLLVPFNYGQNCQTTYTVDLVSGQTVTQDVPVALEPDCPLMGVDLSSPLLRRCFSNYYTVQACNYSTQTIEDVHVEVQLDQYFEFNSAGLPATDLGNNTYSFQLGDLAAGECTDFRLNFTISCDATLGATHCSEAHLFPDTLCPVSANWSGADIQVDGYCDGDSVRLQISNLGTGNMAQALDFIVVEDVIMYQADDFQLNIGETREITVPANGATWRLQADQEPFHPYGGPEAVAIEGCGGLNQTGLVTLLPINNPNPFIVTDCQENVGSYDPNDKQAVPKGYGDDHLLEANKDIEYMIRFQNTGTDTAFNIVVLDTLSEYLNLAKIRPGTASHPYNFSILEGNVLQFSFSNIALPDSNVNETASHGFVKFLAPQMADNPNGTRIENTAYIYFDFNDPVATNTTFHTIGDHFILTAVEDPGMPTVSVFPNPAGDAALLTLPEHIADGNFILTNNIGNQVSMQSFNGNNFRFERAALPAGVYYFRILNGNKIYSSGKILLK